MRKQKAGIQMSLKLRNSDALTCRENIIEKVRTLICAHASGVLGGETMPEDARPDIDKRSAELAHYFTLGMSLNYQRNSYSLWRSCTKAWEDSSTKWIFYPEDVAGSSDDSLRQCLLLYRVGLQPNNHVKIWRAVATGISRLYANDIRTLFRSNGGHIGEIKAAIQRNRKSFPYLSGAKICNYWLYVMYTFTDNQLNGKSDLNVAPDTHVIKASYRLGLITAEEIERSDVREIVSERWVRALEGTGIDPIDVHTPMWLWSRAGFPNVSEPNDIL